jgi:hypothetical protein
MPVKKRWRYTAAVRFQSFTVAVEFEMSAWYSGILSIIDLRFSIKLFHPVGMGVVS